MPTNSSKLPKPLRDVAAGLARLPGLGPKSGLRAALWLLKADRAEAEALGRSILELRETLTFCDRCGVLTEQDPCPLCADPTRDDAQLMVVSDMDSLLALEDGAFYRGYYLVLGGLIAPLDDHPADRIDFSRLLTRLGEGNVRELVLALGATLEAEATASHIKNMVEGRFAGVSVSRLAQGIPLGSEVKFMDKETLRQSLEHRQKL